MRILIGLLLSIISCGVFAQEVKPKIAVTDLAYEQQVKDSVRVANTDENGYSHQQKIVEGSYTYISQKELPLFVGDIKKYLLKSGDVELIQGRPYSGDAEFDNIQDMIARIEQGDFEGADYVLFGRISDIQFANSTMNIQHTDTYSKSLSLTVVAEFSLINTSTYEIKSAFTAMGEAKEVKLVNSLDKVVTLNRAKLVAKAANTLGQDVANQLIEQLTGKSPEAEYNPPVRHNIPPDLPPTVIRKP